MKFTLTFDGSLPSSGNKPKNQAKWEIRQKLHPQLADLWASHPALIEIEKNGRYFPTVGGATLTQTHHQHPGPIHPPIQAPIVGDVQRLNLGMIGGLVDSEPRDFVDLCESTNKHGAWFRPLVRETFALHCGLKVIFLRKEPPGNVYQGGDIDGRMKTLIDALAMPQHQEQVLDKSSTKATPIYCLLEDDKMISGLAIESERLLGDHSEGADFVRLTIEVDVRVRRAMIYNQSFLG
jgi:hypothetical protein